MKDNWKGSKKSGIPTGDKIWILIVVLGTAILAAEIVIRTYWMHRALVP